MLGVVSLCAVRVSRSQMVGHPLRSFPRFRRSQTLCPGIDLVGTDAPDLIHVTTWSGFNTR